MTREGGRRPGVVKARSAPLISRRNMPLLKSSDYRLRELFENADVMSEGKTREDPEGATYYGSTSVLVPFASRGGRLADEQADEVLALLGSDPHARIRAIRIACLEAQIRARAPIGKIRAELFVRRDRQGLRIDVEVEARVFEEATHGANRRSARTRKGPASR